MNEQWNTALDQVKDEYLEEAASYRPKRHWIRFVSAAAAVLVLVVSWSVLRPEPPSIDPTISDITTPTSGTEPTTTPPSFDPGPSWESPSYAPSYNPIEPIQLTPIEIFVQFWEDLFGTIEYCLLKEKDELQHPAIEADDSITPYIKDQPDYTQLRYYCESYEEFQEACKSGVEISLNLKTMVPYSGDKPMEIQSISFFKKDIGGLPWTWYQTSNDPDITIRVATYATKFDSGASGAKTMYKICRDAPNLHNRDIYEEHYPQIQEVTITTAEGEKSALMKYSADLDLYFLSFTQNGSLVTIAGDESILEAQWLKTFQLAPIDSL